MTWKRWLGGMAALGLLCACAAPGKHAVAALPGQACGRFQMQNLSMADGSTPDHEFVFLIHDAQGDSAALIVVPDAQGKVADIGLVSGAPSCPKAA